ncbi:MAG: tetraacyldisaccharide 4'-kinase [Rikenellaceae bacterium]|jgi:tetraacyldisaccharide 4'-kinase|nr:tetraacyldisaccharide 4'-kinase [Rikenellaceae bacterium]
MLKAILGTPVSWIYGLAIYIRHKLFDWKILKAEEFDIPIVCVGNITVGGTGKTPHTEFLINHFRRKYNVAVLSRGYRRKSKGFVLASADSSFRQIGDEPKQIKLKFPDVPVAVCKNRNEGIRTLRELHPEVNLIILDDGFQYRRTEAWVNILLVDYNRPTYRDHLLPVGSLRDLKGQMHRAQFVIVTKCPVGELKPIDYRVARKALNLYPYQTLYFSHVEPGEPVPLFPEQERRIPVHGQPVVGMAGVADPVPFFADLAKHYQVTETLAFPDHYVYRMRDLRKINETLAGCPKDTLVVVTEKDAVKLTNRKKVSAKLQRKLYYVPIRVAMVGETAETDFYRQLDQYVKSNQKYSILHPE